MLLCELSSRGLNPYHLLLALCLLPLCLMLAHCLELRGPSSYDAFTHAQEERRHFCFHRPTSSVPRSRLLFLCSCPVPVAAPEVSQAPNPEPQHSPQGTHSNCSLPWKIKFSILIEKGEEKEGHTLRLSQQC